MSEVWRADRWIKRHIIENEKCLGGGGGGEPITTDTLSLAAEGGLWNLGEDGIVLARHPGDGGLQHGQPRVSCNKNGAKIKKNIREYLKRALSSAMFGNKKVQICQLYARVKFPHILKDFNIGKNFGLFAKITFFKLLREECNASVFLANVQLCRRSDVYFILYNCNSDNRRAV